MVGEPLALLLTAGRRLHRAGPARGAQHPDHHEDPAEPHRPPPGRALRWMFGAEPRREAERRMPRPQPDADDRRRRTRRCRGGAATRPGARRIPSDGIGSQDLTELLPPGAPQGGFDQAIDADRAAAPAVTADGAHRGHRPVAVCAGAKRGEAAAARRCATTPTRIRWMTASCPVCRASASDGPPRSAPAALRTGFPSVNTLAAGTPHKARSRRTTTSCGRSRACSTSSRSTRASPASRAARRSPSTRSRSAPASRSSGSPR